MAIKATSNTHYWDEPLVIITRSTRDSIMILPDYGTPGVCKYYDEGCMTIPENHPEYTAEEAWAVCYKHDPMTERCPFVD